MSTIPVKISIQEFGTRRLNIARNSSFTAFQDTVKELFGIENRLDWVYVDEENDLVTFSTDQEFKDVLLSWNEQNILRLNATPAPIIQQRVEQPQPTHQQPVHTGCPFQPQAASTCQRGCCNDARRCLSMPSRIAVGLGLFYSIFTHPFLTFIGLLSVMLISRHNYPAVYEKLTVHARNHWRKVAFAYGLYMLFNCKVCTMLVVVPVAYLLIKKFRQCHGENAKCGTNECCYVKVRDTVKQFMARNNITLDGIERIVQNVTLPQAPQSPQAQPEVPQQKSVEASAPPMSSMYPPVTEEITSELLPERSERSQYQEQVDVLVELGFTNRKLNEHLLNNFNGNLDRVLNSLIQLQTMQ